MDAYRPLASTALALTDKPVEQGWSTPKLLQ